jgi:hypothetical protein
LVVEEHPGGYAQALDAAKNKDSHTPIQMDTQTSPKHHLVYMIPAEQGGDSAVEQKVVSCLYSRHTINKIAAGVGLKSNIPKRGLGSGEVSVYLDNSKRGRKIPQVQKVSESYSTQLRQLPEGSFGNLHCDDSLLTKS